jgi:hypothetical protein
MVLISEQTISRAEKFLRRGPAAIIRCTVCETVPTYFTVNVDATSYRYERSLCALGWNDGHKEYRRECGL